MQTPNLGGNGDYGYASFECRELGSLFGPHRGGGNVGNPPPRHTTLGRPDNEGSAPTPARPRTPEEKGKAYRDAFKTTLEGDQPPLPGNFERYDTQMSKHSYFVDKKDPTLDDPDGAYKAQVAGQNSPIFDAKINMDEYGHMAISGMYRTDGISNSIYGGIPREDRPYISDHMAKAYSELSDGKPLSKVTYDSIINQQMTDKLDVWAGKKGTRDLSFSEKDPEWNWVLSSELGSPLSRTVLDHPQVYGAQKPSEVRFHQEGGMWKADFDLSRVKPETPST